MDGSSQTPPPNTFSIGIELLGGVSDVTIRGLEIRDYSRIFGDPEDDDSDAILAGTGTTSGIAIHYNYLHDNAGNGVRLRNSTNALHDNWEVENNFITDNGGNEIGFNNAVESEIKDNFIRGNGARGISINARNFTGVGDVTVSDVVIKRNEVSHDLEGSGINLNARVDAGGTARLTGIRVQDNNLHDNAEGGIVLQARGLGATIDLTRVEDNHVSGNFEFGILLIGRGEGVITENQALSNYVGNNIGEGILVIAREEGSVDNNKIDLNMIYSNGEHGILLHARNSGVVEDNKLEDNTVNDNGFLGVHLEAFSGGTMTGNEFDGNSVTGATFSAFVAEAGTADNLFTENLANANGGFGYDDNGANTFEDNQCNFNGLPSSPAGLCSP